MIPEMLSPEGGGGIPADLQLDAEQVNPDGIFTQNQDFLGLPPEVAMILVQMIKQIAETGEVPPEIMQLLGGGGMPPMGGMPQQGPPQGMPPMGMPPGGMPMPPMGMPPGPPPGGMPPMPMGGQGMAEGGMVGDETLEDLHRQINETKQRLKEREKQLKDEYQPQKQGSQEGAPNRPLAFQEGGAVRTSDTAYSLPQSSLNFDIPVPRETAPTSMEAYLDAMNRLNPPTLTRPEHKSLLEGFVGRGPRTSTLTPQENRRFLSDLAMPQAPAPKPVLSPDWQSLVRQPSAEEISKWEEQQRIWDQPMRDKVTGQLESKIDNLFRLELQRFKREMSSLDDSDLSDEAWEQKWWNVKREHDRRREDLIRSYPPAQTGEFPSQPHDWSDYRKGSKGEPLTDPDVLQPGQWAKYPGQKKTSN